MMRGTTCCVPQLGCAVAKLELAAWCDGMAEWTAGFCNARCCHVVVTSASQAPAIEIEAAVVEWGKWLLCVGTGAALPNPTQGLRERHDMSVPGTWLSCTPFKC